MSLRTLVFFAWCGLLLFGTTLAAHYAWSPYADAHHGGHGGAGGHGGHGYGAYYGPMHK